MRRLYGQGRGGNTPIIGHLSHLGRTFYTVLGPPAPHLDADAYLTCTYHTAVGTSWSSTPCIPVPRLAAGRRQGALASLPLVLFKCPATTLLDSRRIASSILPPPHPRRYHHCTARLHPFAPRTRDARFRNLTKSDARPISFIRDLHDLHDLHTTSSPRGTLSMSTMTQPEWTGVKVRNTFFEFFEQRGHTIVPSSSVVPHNDPTLRE